ncbi:MAG: flippase, partial [Candidatus Spechtbacterales bacterium]|nr:flippase [Candidatus Spechtbacterales bacterium]
QIFLGVFQKYIQIYKAAIAEVLGRAVQLGLVWYFFQNNSELLFFLSALIVGSFVIFITNFIFARRLVRFNLKTSLKEWKRIIKTTYPIAVSLVFTLLYFKLDTILLSIMKSQEDVGIYNAAYKVLETIIFFPAAFIGLMLPRLSEYIKESKEKFSDLLSSLNDIMTISALPVVVGGFLVSESMVYLIGGSEFLLASAPLQVLFFAIGIIFYGTLYGNTVIALGIQKKAMWAYFWGFALNFIANLVFIPKYSYMGAAWTTLITEIFVTAYLLWIIKKEVNFVFSIKTTIKAVFATALMGLFVWFIYGLDEGFSISLLFGTILGGGVIYTFLVGRSLRKLSTLIQE